MKSKAVFILPAHDTDRDSWKYPSWRISHIPPIGLISMISYLHAKGHEVKLIDCRELIFHYQTNEILPIIEKIIYDFNPDFVGINILTALFDEAKKIMRHVKERYPQIPLIAGGPHPSVEPLLTLEQIDHIDAVCVGPGEEQCLELLEGKSIEGIQGLMVRGMTEKYKKREVELNIDKYPFPNYDLVNYFYYSACNAYTTFGWLTKSLSAMTSRSCPYSCKFCASDWSKPARFHSDEYVIELVKYLANYDINAIAFWDDTIAIKNERLYKICEGFLRSGLFMPEGRLRWRASLRANQITPELLRVMKEAGCYHIAIGIESGADRVLKILNKKSTVEMNRQACAYVQEAGLDLGVSFMVGVPDETESEVRETFSFIKSLNCNTKGFGNFRPLPGSPFYYEFIEKGILQKENLDWSNLGNFSTLPEQIFCNVEQGKLHELIREGGKIAYADQHIAVHEDIASECHLLVGEIRNDTDVRVVSLDGISAKKHFRKCAG